jgi:hypothetical protein
MWSRATGIAVAAALLFASTAAAQQPTGPFAPWDGRNPFNCTIQDVGTGVDFPDPGADPFCVEFDKTQQNVTDLGILDFLANEPIRVAAAVNKCFYFQTDHWTGSVVQGEEPELWHWDGQYFSTRRSARAGSTSRTSACSDSRRASRRAPCRRSSSPTSIRAAAGPTW